MDTPERNQIGTPLSKFEESPFSNFANNLSPINAVKTMHVSQTFSSLSFTSPPSVFTSPHVSLQKESRFLRRHQVSDLAKAQCSTDEGNKYSEAEQGTNTGQQSNNSTNGEARTDGVSCSEGAVEPRCGVSERETELPRGLTYDSGSPNYRTAGSPSIVCEPDSSLALVPFVEDISVRGSFGTEMKPQDGNHDNEEAACDWESLITCNTNLFAFDSPNDAETLKGPFRKSLEEETNVYASLLSRFPSDQTNAAQNSCHATLPNFNEAHETVAQSTQPTDASDLEQIDRPPENLGVQSVNEYFAAETGEKPGNENFNGLYRGMRRRCLTFDMARPKKCTEIVPFVSSMDSVQNKDKTVYTSRQPITSQGDSSRCVFPGIGLHLNALAAASKDCGIPYQEMISPPDEDCGKDGRPSENGAELLEEYAANTAADELNSTSPKKKKRKSENTGEGESCKRCNCKKSKCLKLYCECFAAGVYCVEPCSCQECFNKPIHEDIVLATRKQIESRNPLAFAPKVIRGLDSAQEIGQEDSSKTPASARHKRGCNCKKSNCLKKYCECYQGGVGCSINCRCEGCKNAFGRKDGSIFLVIDTETEEQASEKRITDKSLDPPGLRHDETKSSEFSLPKTPLTRHRHTIPIQTSSKGKPPRSSLMPLTSSSSLHPIDTQVLPTFPPFPSKNENHYPNVLEDDIPTVLHNISPPSNGLKTLSPNSKRISPPHHDKGQSPKLRTSRKLILQSIPSFPSLTPGR